MTSAKKAPPAKIHHELTVTWTTSRGRDTYGYNIVTLRERGDVVARCNGGGYDMRGTVFADWLEKLYQAELVKAGRQLKRVVYNKKAKGEDKYTYPDSDNRKKLYGGKFYPKGDERRAEPFVSLDGGCGMSSIERIAGAIGLSVRVINTGSKSDLILVTNKE